MIIRLTEAEVRRLRSDYEVVPTGDVYLAAAQIVSFKHDNHDTPAGLDRTVVRTTDQRTFYVCEAPDQVASILRRVREETNEPHTTFDFIEMDSDGDVCAVEIIWEDEAG